MSTDQLFLGIDSGTQGTKVIVFSTTQKKVISEGYASHNLIENDEGKKEQEPSCPSWVTNEDQRELLERLLRDLG